MDENASTLRHAASYISEDRDFSSFWEEGIDSPLNNMFGIIMVLKFSIQDFKWIENNFKTFYRKWYLSHLVSIMIKARVKIFFLIFITFFFFFGCPLTYGVLVSGIRSKLQLWSKPQLWQHLGWGSNLGKSVPKKPPIHCTQWQLQNEDIFRYAKCPNNHPLSFPQSYFMCF